MKDHAVMSPELIGILGVGVSLAGMILAGFLWMDGRINGLDSRLREVEQNQSVLLERTRHLEPLTATVE